MFYLIEIMAPAATTYNFTVRADTREAAIAEARNLGVEPIAARLYDQPYRLNQPTPPWA
jgi:hypothetical protein